MLRKVISVVLGIIILLALFFFVKGLISNTKTKNVTELQTITPPTQTVTDGNLPAGATATQQPGADGSKKVTYKVTTDKKGAVIKKEQKSEQIITQPKPKVVAVSDKATPQTGPEDAYPFILTAIIGAYLMYIRSQKKLRLALVSHS